jgi:hypothetical protein
MYAVKMYGNSWCRRLSDDVRSQSNIGGYARECLEYVTIKFYFSPLGILLHIRGHTLCINIVVQIFFNQSFKYM